MEDQNKKNCDLYDCSRSDKKEIYKMIDYFMCRLRRSLLLVIGIQMFVNFFLGVFILLITNLIGINKPSRIISDTKKAVFEKRKGSSGDSENKEVSGSSEDNNESSPWKQGDLEAIKESSISVSDDSLL